MGKMEKIEEFSKIFLNNFLNELKTSKNFWRKFPKELLKTSSWWNSCRIHCRISGNSRRCSWWDFRLHLWWNFRWNSRKKSQRNSWGSSWDNWLMKCRRNSWNRYRKMFREIPYGSPREFADFLKKIPIELFKKLLEEPSNELLKIKLPRNFRWIYTRKSLILILIYDMLKGLFQVCSKDFLSKFPLKLLEQPSMGLQEEFTKIDLNDLFQKVLWGIIEEISGHILEATFESHLKEATRITQRCSNITPAGFAEWTPGKFLNVLLENVRWNASRSS